PRVCCSVRSKSIIVLGKFGPVRGGIAANVGAALAAGAITPFAPVPFAPFAPFAPLALASAGAGFTTTGGCVFARPRRKKPMLCLLFEKLEKRRTAGHPRLRQDAARRVASFRPHDSHHDTQNAPLSRLDITIAATQVICQCESMRKQIH